MLTESLDCLAFQVFEPLLQHVQEWASNEPSPQQVMSGTEANHCHHSQPEFQKTMLKSLTYHSP